MEPGSFISALLAIVVIDIVLAGDNAIVIALAARSLPAHLQRRAIVWGTVGAIVVRSLMTLAVVMLLKVPGLLLAGGVMLLWICWRMLVPAGDKGHAEQHPVTGFWGAMRTIVIADAVMGLDNVLAVAGAAHGSYLLVVTGLLLSVPIVVWGSTLVLQLVNRYPAVVYLGGAVLVLTSVKMIVGEPLLAPWYDKAPVLRSALFLLIPLVLWLAFVRNHRRLASRIHARLAENALLRPSQYPAGGGSEVAHFANTASAETGDKAMLKILIPIDGSDNSLQAVRHVMNQYRRDHELMLHLLNVQPRLSRHVARFVTPANRQRWHQERAQAAMADAQALLTDAGIPFESHCVKGDRAKQICHHSERLGVHQIVMGTARKNSITRMLEDSVTSRVLETAPVPVEMVPGAAVSRWERWGLPAGVTGVLGWLAWSID